MDLSYSHAHNQRVLKQRNLLVVVAVGLAGLTALLLLFGISRDREIVLQPVLRSPVTVSSASVGSRSVFLRRPLRTDEIADCLMSFIRHPDRGQLSGAEQARQRHCIAPIGLDLVTRTSRHH